MESSVVDGQGLYGPSGPESEVSPSRRFAQGRCSMSWNGDKRAVHLSYLILLR